MGFSDAKIVPTPPYTPPGSIGIREGFGPLELFQGFFDSLNTPGFTEAGSVLQADPLQGLLAAADFQFPREKSIIPLKRLTQSGL